jgi:hypothetical protein
MKVPFSDIEMPMHLLQSRGSLATDWTVKVVADQIEYRLPSPR